VKPKLRVWVVFGKHLKLGDGRARLLELIDERGSLRQAAAGLGMSYRNAWGYLRELEKAAGFPFVEPATRGSTRSGLRLTASGRQFLACYRKFQRSLDGAAVRHFERAFRKRR
jgi:molybdate transport system regulatory protein